MPLQAQTPKVISHPEIPFDKVLYGINFYPVILPNGALDVNVQLNIFRARMIPGTTNSPVDKWEKDPTSKPVARSFPTISALIQAVPEVQAQIAEVWGKINVAVNTINTKLKLV